MSLDQTGLVKKDTEDILSTLQEIRNGYNSPDIRRLSVIEHELYAVDLGKDVELLNISGSGKLFSISSGYTSSSFISNLAGTEYTVEIDGEVFLNVVWEQNYGWGLNLHNIWSCLMYGNRAALPYTIRNGKDLTRSITNLDSYTFISKETPVVSKDYGAGYSNLFVGKPVDFSQSLKITCHVISSSSSNVGRNLVSRIHYLLND